jgi:DUF1680 family protein
LRVRDPFASRIIRLFWVKAVCSKFRIKEGVLMDKANKKTNSKNENNFDSENVISRRKFLATAAAVPIAMSPLAETLAGAVSSASSTASAGKVRLAGKIVISPFDYQGVTLGPSRWQKQYESARNYYLAVSDDDILCGFRRAANLPAPGAPLGGWAAQNSSTVFGQWLQAMARTSQANNDTAMKDKANLLVDEWAKTLVSNSNAMMRHYPWEKLLGGLSDMNQYAGNQSTPALMEKITDLAIANLDRTRTPAANKPWELHSGTPLEWYTLSENPYRAYVLTGNSKYKDFGDVWRYDAYWNKFANTSNPQNAQGVHAYSHCNSFSGAAMAYLIEGDPKLLTEMKNFYDFLQNSQTYATGGYGPAERYVYNDGALGESMALRLDSFEAPCCTWASFKLAKYLMTYTGESRYGDWIEKLLYNAIGAALPITERGKHFYYANYHLGSGMKIYSRSTYTCCSGTYFQNVAEYQNLIYFKDASPSLYVNLYLPSEVSWQIPGSSDTVKLTQETQYPEAETINFKLAMASPANFSLKFRIPAWSKGVSFKLNGSALYVATTPGQWATINRQWKNGDQVEMRNPMTFRRVPIDKWHPNRVAIMLGPVVYAQQVSHRHYTSIPWDDETLNKWMLQTNNPTTFQYQGQEQASQRDDFMPFYQFAEMQTYRMYFDPALRTNLW